MLYVSFRASNTRFIPLSQTKFWHSLWRPHTSTKIINAETTTFTHMLIIHLQERCIVHIRISLSGDDPYQFMVYRIIGQDVSQKKKKTDSQLKHHKGPNLPYIASLIIYFYKHLICNTTQSKMILITLHRQCHSAPK